MKQTNHNKSFFIIAMAFRTVALLCVTGPIMQTFLASIGFSSQWIYIHTSIVQAVNILTISLCSTWADRGNVIKRTAFVELPYALLSAGVSFVGFVLAGIIQNALIVLPICLVVLFVALLAIRHFQKKTVN